ncbi:MAG: cytochrome B [Gammaproteobacteria bacterium CG_4_10_14_0_8_um_filter_38_16]|nr:MAG: cytochrome B [Gammaproteobacteria bacterium CG_4_10_14_0_8_um_filter_38_16]PJA04422.1 MAG: cytochrome B [Gammaproteobacteria bacterium CG_4_10_14_0_2_um_filter_38_22]PJB10156.1 MAG: cytochrome B [Gammaproteobacteria bacterium CG_4_9_14_3_um_filter_38_9]
MIFKNTTHRFGLIAILLHWIMVIVMIGLTALGLYMVRIPVSIQKLQFYGWHKEWGILALMLVIVRLTWRLRNQTPTLSALEKWESFAAHAVHWAFYFFMFALPITGWLITSSSDLPVSVFGFFTLPNLVLPNETNRILFSSIHEWLGYALIATFCLHTGAAIKHHFINKDKIMRRMLWP